MVSPAIGQCLRLDAVLDRHAGIIHRTSGKGQAGVRVHSRTTLPAYVCKAEDTARAGAVSDIWIVSERSLACERIATFLLLSFPLSAALTPHMTGL